MAQDEPDRLEHLDFAAIRAWLRARPFRGPEPIDEETP